MTRHLLLSRVLLMATPDDAIPGVARELARMGTEELRGKIVLHPSGALDSRLPALLKECGAAVGSMHPLQTFSGVGVPLWRGKSLLWKEIPLGCAPQSKSPAHLEDRRCGFAGDRKTLYHAAAAMASGHVLALVEAATQLLISLGMKHTEAERALLPLTRQEVLDNFQRLGPRAAWTGPLARGDYKIVEAHLRALPDSHVEASQAYEALNRLAACVLSQDAAGTSAELEKISAALKPKAKVRGGYG